LNKAKVRSHFRQLRKLLSEAAYQEANWLLYQRLFPFLQKQNPATVHCFLPITKNREVDTWPVVHWLWQRQIKVVVPRSEPATNHLQHILLGPHTPTAENSWRIPEPVGEGLRAINEDTLDIVLLPLLAFDQQGHRVGYGKGYYDRFLKGCRPGTLRVGLSLFAPIDRITDVSPLDVRMDAAVTPEHIWLFTES